MKLKTELYSQQYGREWLLEIEDISAFVAEQRDQRSQAELGRLITPAESVYPVKDPNVAKRLRLDDPSIEVSDVRQA